VKRLIGERLTLEPVTAANAVTLWRIMQTGQLREYQDVPRYTREEFERRVASRPKVFDARALGRFEWLVVLRSTKRAIGWLSLRVGDQERRTAEIGYSIVNGFRGAGYATEAARLIVEFAFEESDLRELSACCVPANAASRRLLASVGFLERRVQRNGAIVRGQPVDIVIFELPRERYRSRLDHGKSANSIVIPASANPK
jgi:ribosomal-protein-alanine N-acetyltransferase